ncbi:ribosomal protein L11 methyltransferase [Neosynechococcus sphagnicola sy1]|uniref:Ribosomal protein L11 methyltransferase n=1 Tax=Neosynechococcus sphagnicola sy1 TaxID=1497020 RepID=A0A098TRP2_9CYAN|nr:50S ribosomal protein L11 methyltransferase [Neosynechococcus sphagnicola]KGF73473.1 ribosomal protein L11 methyltransferase [Neosynechococcus sphagnicola sy1]
MTWMELSLDTTPEAVDWVCTLLATTSYVREVRVRSSIASDGQRGGVEHCPLTEQPIDPAEATPGWAFTICFYLPYDLRVRARVDAIEALLSPLQRTGIATVLEVAIVSEQPEYPVASIPLIHRIGERFVVLAPGVPYPSQQSDEILLRLEASLAFGSGLHPATAVSLQLLERHVVPTMQVLDLGSGTGILSVAIAKLGAQVLALDNDLLAVQATQAAVEQNQVEQQVTARAGSLGCGSRLGHWLGGDILDQAPSVNVTQAFDLIMANILARVHIALADDFKQALRQTHAQGGVLITSGFTTDQEEAVDTALSAAGFASLDREQCREWVALAHRLT